MSVRDLFLICSFTTFQVPFARSAAAPPMSCLFVVRCCACALSSGYIRFLYCKHIGLAGTYTSEESARPQRHGCLICWSLYVMLSHVLRRICLQLLAFPSLHQRIQLPRTIFCIGGQFAACRGRTWVHMCYIVYSTLVSQMHLRFAHACENMGY